MDSTDHNVSDLGRVLAAEGVDDDQFIGDFDRTDQGGMNGILFPVGAVST
jgi:hypothetical protein